jgi:apolipoprotein N-acyltransferase
LAALQGWRRYASAAAFGAATAGALPPYHALPLLVVGFTGLLWLTPPTLEIRARFATGWWFGFGFFLLGLYWLANALLIDAQRFGWLVPFAVLGLPAVLALFTGAALAALAPAIAGTGARVLGLALAWIVAEWLRGHVLTGFPWNLVGYAWLAELAIAQAASVVGVYGLSFLTVAIGAAPAALADRAASPVRRFGPPAAAAIVLAGLAAWGAARLAANPLAFEPGVALRIVQANVPQTLKWRDDFRAAALARHLDMSAAPGTPPVTHLIWPETAVPYLLADDPEHRRALAGLIRPGGLVLTGVVRAFETAPKRLTLRNSVIAIDAASDVVAAYDKFHLVPFGEYLPLRALLAPLGIDKIVFGPVDFSPGPGPVTLTVPGLPPFSPLVCYEAIFPGRVVDRGAARPAWLLNVSNDGWYGDSAGPHQHLAMARMRTIEEGLPLVRAANTGITAIVGPLGQVVGSLGYGQQGVVESGLPKPIQSTTYGRFGDPILVFPALLLIGYFLAVGVMQRTASQKRGR